MSQEIVRGHPTVGIDGAGTVRTRNGPLAGAMSALTDDMRPADDMCPTDDMCLGNGMCLGAVARGCTAGTRRPDEENGVFGGGGAEGAPDTHAVPCTDRSAKVVGTR
ncbi:hypothetical protein [Streptomyces viridiviolaceus]|uniref:hypothetical protein n=1 Tax=Streptomyces viridiviolaceus TaxID=68282 RepID=UPI00167B57EE|nr:hypothetical protein [Streptomyces viridiviolaceus]